ncbi:hypothetical protein [Prosthecobacter vanneervenii]|uniref:Lipoprotein n=1 Tax=Prosthecobacter vanneervenii TaxID=48466 RepID=A0A7W7YCC5_9BACT|nr:hypothetical protein [Prosthecobacter vanneervenii]MBB5033601.1 hypothetical protein [Prosthecobacter vanneervenii]
MRSLSLAVALLSLVLSSCQGPKVKIVFNQLKPGQLEGKTVGVEGMVITAACWPGRYLDGPVLFAAEKGLQHRLKGARFCVIDEAGAVMQEAGPSRPGSDQLDYVFKIMLREDSVTHGVSRWSGGINSKRMTNRRDPGFNAFGGWRGFTGDYSFPYREVTKRTLKAEYTLSDHQTCKIIWRAEVESSDTYVELEGSGSTYRNARTVEREVPLQPLLVALNTAAVKAIRKSRL